MKYIKNEDAVSPVIGVILMVVITVIIAAVLAVFAFGVGAPAKAPTASVKIVSTDITGDKIRLAQTGGDGLVLKNVKLIVEQTTAAGVVSRMSIDQVDTGVNKFTPGDTIEVVASTGVDTLNNGAVALTHGTLTQFPVGSVVLATGSDVVVTLIDVPTGQEITSAKVTI